MKSATNTALETKKIAINNPVEIIVHLVRCNVFDKITPSKKALENLEYLESNRR